MEKTFVMVKPDGVQRQLIGEILLRFERKGLQLIGAKLMKVSEETAGEHYKEHNGKPFFGELVDFITSGPVFAMVWEGEDAIAVARQLIGKTNPKEALPGTIRGDFGMFVGKISFTVQILLKVQHAKSTCFLKRTNLLKTRN